MAAFLNHRFLSRTSRGFTLIELLIVIAVLGILAAVILVALDPLEQVARSRDAGRISTVAQLGRAVQAYATNNDGVYVTPSTTWQTALVTAGEIKQIATVPNTNATTCTPATGQQGNVCFGADADGDYVIWTTLESKSTRTKAKQSSSTPTCTETTVISMWSSKQGKAGIACASPSGVPDADTYLQ